MISETTILCFAGLANAVKGIREVGFAASFAEKSLGVNAAITCADAQSALALWTMAQAGLGMAQLAAAGEGQRSPHSDRIKTQAKGKSVIISVQVLPEDLDELGSFGPGAAFEEDERTRSGGAYRREGGRFDVACARWWRVRLVGARRQEHCSPRFLGHLVRALREGSARSDEGDRWPQGQRRRFSGREPRGRGEPINKFLKRKKWEGLKVALDNEDISSDAFM